MNQISQAVEKPSSFPASCHQGYRRFAEALLWLFLLVPRELDAQPATYGKGAGPRQGSISRIAITITNRANLEDLVQQGYDVDSVRGSQAVLYADNDELASLSGEGWPIVKLPPASSGTAPQKTLEGYNDYTNTTLLLEAYTTNFPSLCRKMSIGKSVQNRDLWAVKITTNPDLPADKPKFKYISTMHGNEPLGTEMCLHFIDRLLTGYVSNDTRIVRLVSQIEIWLIPLMNPDGWESTPPRRYNANGYDLNRSFPEGSGTNLGNRLYGPPVDTNSLQPEVQQVMAWTVAHNFSLGANFHSGDLVVNYPYDNDNMGSVFSPSPDEALFQAISRSYSSNNPPMWNSPFFSQGIVNGAAWYAISGGMQDWNYRYAGCFEVTIELSQSYWPDPPASQIPVYWSQNQESMLTCLEWSLRGVRGLIRNAQTGQPVAGAVRVDGFHHLVFSDPQIGDYHRLLLPGTYTLWFYAPGFVPQRITGVVVGSGEATRLDVAMQPASPRFAAKINFQPAGAPLPAGFEADSGAVFEDRGNGYAYGWETNLPGGNVIARAAGRSQDLRYDTLCDLQANGSHVWELALPPGPYSILIVAGDPFNSNGVYHIMAEDMPLLDGVSTSSNHWAEALATVVVTDGRLTLRNGDGAINNRLAFLEIGALEPATIEQWRALFFGVTANLGLAADTADPDGDGIPNLLEYAFGLHPSEPDVGLQLSSLIVQTNKVDWFGCSLLRNTNATDLTFRVQAADTLSSATWPDVASWTSVSAWTGPGRVWETTARPNVARATVLDTRPMLTATNRFMRLRVTRP